MTTLHEQQVYPTIDQIIRAEATSRFLAYDKSVAKAARSLGVATNTLRKWLRDNSRQRRAAALNFGCVDYDMQF